MWWIIVGIAIVVAVTGYFVFGRSVGGATAHGVTDEQPVATYDRQAQEPAEPGSEDQAVVDDGVIGPKPDAASQRQSPETDLT